MSLATATEWPASAISADDWRTIRAEDAERAARPLYAVPAHAAFDAELNEWHATRAARRARARRIQRAAQAVAWTVVAVAGVAGAWLFIVAMAAGYAL